MIEITYQELMDRISRGAVIPKGLWIEDPKGIRWYWEDGNFRTGMKEGDKEPPFIYLTDKYNLMELYTIKFKIKEPKDEIKPNALVMDIQQILARYGNGDENIGLLDTSTGEMWEFVPLSQNIINRDGDKITEYVDEDRLSTLEFEIMYQEKALEKEDMKDTLLGAALTDLDEINKATTKLKLELDDIIAHTEHMKKLFDLYNDMPN